MDVVKSQRKMARGATSSSSSTTTTASINGSTASSTSHNNNKTGEESNPSSNNNNNNPTNTPTTPPLTSSRPGLLARLSRRRNNDSTPPIPPRPRMRRAFSAPAAPGRRRRRRRLLMEDHFRVDPERRVVLPGVPAHDPNWARDLHDFFNLIVLIPVVALNVMCWDWDLILKLCLGTAASHNNNSGGGGKRGGRHHHHDHHHNNNAKHITSLEDAWTGEWFYWFFWVTVVYFVVDLIWIVAVPKCVKSPTTIIQHHVATMLYILIPFCLPEFQWCMGACMSVEINTWFLIARRVFNKQGFPPWIINFSFVSIRVKLISVLFYITWIAIRCLVYPYLMPRFYENWLRHSERVGTPYNLVALSVPLHAAFCLLNLKWTYDLLMSKIRFWTRSNKTKWVEGGSVDKGL